MYDFILGVAGYWHYGVMVLWYYGIIGFMVFVFGS
jgi:hypothetical protein